MQFVLLEIIKNPNQSKVVEFFDELEERIGIDALSYGLPYGLKYGALYNPLLVLIIIPEPAIPK